MKQKDIILQLIEEAKSHDPNEIMCCTAGYREDNNKDYFTWGEYIDALTTQSGYVWETLVKDIVNTCLEKENKKLKERFWTLRLTNHVYTFGWVCLYIFLILGWFAILLVAIFI